MFGRNYVASNNATYLLMRNFGITSSVVDLKMSMRSPRARSNENIAGMLLKVSKPQFVSHRTVHSIHNRLTGITHVYRSSRYS